jgi:hypothetical protein
MSNPASWRVLDLLDRTRNSPTRTEKDAEIAICTLETMSKEEIGEESWHGCPRGLVEFPDLLLRYIAVLEIDFGDLASMFARCIETHSNTNSMATDVSLDILLEYWSTVRGAKPRLDLMLLVGRYPIDDKRYQKCKALDVVDIYYDGAVRYHHSLVSDGKYYFGYRNVYHALLYLPHNEYTMRPLIEMWDSEVNCTIEAALDFFDIPRSGKTYEKDWRPALIKKMYN